MPELLCACLCAAWCDTCTAYRPVFAAQAAAAGITAAWIDIEDDAAVVEGLDVDDFPTLLIARGDEVLFLGPLTPQPQTLARLLAAARDGALPPMHPAVPDLPARVRAARPDAGHPEARSAPLGSSDRRERGG